MSNLVERDGKLLLKAGSLAVATDPCTCCETCENPGCQLVLKYVDENECEDDVFDIYIYNPENPAAREYLGELDLTSNPPGCCNPGCGQTTVEIGPFAVDPRHISSKCTFGIEAEFKRANCCGTWARFSVRIQGSSNEIFGEYFSEVGIKQEFSANEVCVEHPVHGKDARLMPTKVNTLQRVNPLP